MFYILLNECIIILVNSNANGYGAKLIDVSRAIEAYDEFAMEYGKESSAYSAAVLNNEEAQSFEDVTIVNGLWKSDTHVSIIDNYLNSSDNIGADAFKKLNHNRVSIMGIMAKAADTLYGGDVNLLDDYGLAKGESSSALHCIQDTFAHRSVIQPDEISFFSSSDFTTQMWTAFKSGVNSKTVEYRDVYTYTNKSVLSEHQSKIKYEDNSSVGNTRFKDAKKQSAYLLKASLLQSGYSVKWFTGPAYNTELELANGTNAYPE